MKHLLLMNNAVTSDMVRKEEYQGDMHYMIRSATMPDDIVMNGILYPAEEIKKSYMGLEGVHAPLGHPVDNGGNFISATDPFAISNYWVGGQVANVSRENGRVIHDTAININEAKKTDRGKRVLDRVEALMNGDNAKPIHTSTGVYLERQDLDAPSTNAMGQEYNSIGHNFFFDHNAILLDEEGAATPEQGTGMGINSKGEQVDVLVYNAEQIQEQIQEHKEDEIVFSYAGNDKKGFLDKLGEFMKSIGFASSNHDAYNVNTNNQTPVEEIEMTPEEKAAFAAEITKEVVANIGQPIADAVASAVKPVSDMVAEIQTNSQATEKLEKDALIAKSGLPQKVAETMEINQLKAVVEQKESLESGEYGERLGDLSANNRGDKSFNLNDMGAPE